MLLEHKTAVIYGGGGAIGDTVARVFARGMRAGLRRLTDEPVPAGEAGFQEDR